MGMIAMIARSLAALWEPGMSEERAFRAVLDVYGLKRLTGHTTQVLKAAARLI
jgi:hypothetical protein